MPKVVVHPTVAWARRNRSRIRNVAICLALAALYVWFFQGYFFGGLPLSAGTYDALDGDLQDVRLESGQVVASFQVATSMRDVRYTVRSDPATVLKIGGRGVSTSEFVRFADEARYVSGEIVVGDDGLLVSVDQHDP